MLSANPLPSCGPHHTGANIAEALEDTIHQWDLEAEKLVGTITDSGNWHATYLFSWNRFSCFGHNFNVAMEKGLNDGRVQCGIRCAEMLLLHFYKT